MKLIAGLGNPGEEYARTRHNIGFMVLRQLARRVGVSLKRERLSAALIGQTRFERQTVILAMPQTYMNLSGMSVGAIARSKRLEPQDILVVCDDMDIEFGRMKIRAQGSAGGHNGLQSVISSLGTGEVARLRVGIGRPASGEDPADYVLSAFSRQESAVVEEIVERACDCCETWALEGLTGAMNIYNQKVKEETR